MAMSPKEFIEHSKTLEPTFLRKVKHGYVCPFCRQGESKGNGLTRATGRPHLWHCINEGTERSLTGLFAGYAGIPDDAEHFVQIVTECAAYYGIEIDPEKDQDHSRPKAKPAAPAPLQQDHQEEAPDFTDYFRQANKHLAETDYHRGISQATLDRFLIGYDPAWRHPKAPDTVPLSPRLIIPTGQGSYVARDTRSNLTEKQEEYKKLKAGGAHFFNWKGIYKAQKPVIVVEGEIDALSIIDAGGEAVALGSAGMAKTFIKELAEAPTKPPQPFIISKDNDNSGETAAENLRAGFKELGIPFYEIDITGDSKDANEAYMKDPAGFKAAVQKAEAVEIEKESVGYSLQSFLDEITASENIEACSTGFPDLDKILDGGFYPGLYVIGAISSLGKTTFTLQMGDYIAQHGRDVLIISLEMARKELIAKSVSRLTLLNDLEQNGSTAHAKTTRQILTGKLYRCYTPEEKGLIMESIKQYKGYANHLYIHEGIGDIGVDFIKKKVQQYKAITGQAPVVIIDYLQILAPHDPRSTDKQNTDHNITELKRLSRDEDTPVIAISSFNRDNYYSPVGMSAFKESGSVEYSSDVLIALQYDGFELKNDERDQSKERMTRIKMLLEQMQVNAEKGLPQRVQVKILKNRNGIRKTAVLRFYPRFNYFESVTAETETDEWTEARGSYHE